MNYPVHTKAYCVITLKLNLLLTVLLLQLLLLLPLLLLFLHPLVIQTKCPTKATSSGIKTLTTLIDKP